MCNGALNMPDIRSLLAGARVMPILTVHRVESAAPLALALQRGGIKACEVTLRTPAALEVIAAMRAAAPDLITGAGTIRTARDVELALTAGAQFLVSPGTTGALSAALKANGAAALPGAATPSEMMALFEQGFSTLKLFPAEQAGGVGMLKAVNGPMPDLAFCPTGGVTPDSAAVYLALSNVICVGGSWIAPDALVSEGRFDVIAQKAAEAAQL
jgi:2-dehydro-3-deoxyphosphogluconate aldolase/(4S)-4-hydroxy-2-oxoglutarate aldolase